MRPLAPALVVLLLVVVVLGAGCGGSSKEATPPTTAVLEVAGPNPSKTAKMVCEPEVREDLEAALGVAASNVTKPTWNVDKHIYSCTYEYPGGAKMTLTVKELSSPNETSRYFFSLAQSLGRGVSVDIGDGAFRTADDSLVVRKDNKVLLVDVSHLPDEFGTPPISRADTAFNVGSVIMACWVEA
jgi:hypothetical protein